jgi:DNA modification methylase
MKTEIVKLSQIQVNGSNPRIIKDDKFDKLINSILVLPKMLVLRPIVVDDTFVALGGNMRYRALSAIEDMSIEEINNRLSGMRDFQRKTEAEQEKLSLYWATWKDNPTAPIIRASELSEDEQREFIIKDNVGFGEWDMDALANEWDSADLLDWGLDVWDDDYSNGDGSGSGNGDGSGSDETKSLNDAFVVPPFSIFDSRQGYWQERKKMWRERIGDMAESRTAKLVQSVEMRYKDLYTRTMKHRKELGITFKEYIEKYVPKEVLEHEDKKVLSQGVSIFDPVLSEICCKWFTPYEGAKMFDCFAGDTQKGLVFGMCGFEFTGVELRQEQVDINNRVIAERGLPIRYICDDGQNVAKYFEPESQDMLFSCPPYYNLEVYSDLENDASNQGTYEEFIAILKNAYTSALSCLKEDRFAVIVVGDVRNKTNGAYYDFVGDIKRIFREAGAALYNEIILVEMSSSAALRAAKSMESRKVCKTHQNVLVFYKGDPSNVKKVFKPITLSQEENEAMEKLIGDVSEPQGETEGAPADDDEANDLMRELNDFRKPYMKDRLIAYEHYGKIKEALMTGDIHIERDPDTNEIIGYLWLENLKKKPLSRIYEICSARKGLGRKLVEYAIENRTHDTLQLYVVDYNDNAISFYKHMGFVEVERETGKKINNITMEYRPDNATVE